MNQNSSQPIIAHRLYDMLVGGAEVVVLNTLRATPELMHKVVFTRYTPSWISREMEKLPNAELMQMAPERVSDFMNATRASKYLYHYYPPMSELDFRDLSSHTLSRLYLINHWHRPVPHLTTIRYIFLSEESRKKTGKEIPSEQSFIVINPVDKTFLEPVRRTGNRFVIGRHSRDIGIKFSTDCLELFESIRIPNLEVMILGASEGLQNEVATKIERLRHSYFLLPVNSIKVRRFIGMLDLFVYKTHDDFSETCPMNILEAMSIGVPVVAENKGGIRNLVQHGVTGYLCDTNDEFRTYTERLFSDPNLRHQMSIQAREWISKNASPATFRSRMLPLISS